MGSGKLKFDKPPINYDQQIDLLISRGMVIPDRDKARHYLAHLNYYRLGAYWALFESDHTKHTFNADTNFEEVLELYIFDRELRLLIMDAIERIEVSVRAQFAYHLSHQYGAHAYLNQDIFKNTYKYNKSFEMLQGEINRSQELFIKHYKNKYTDPQLPPLWMVVEVMSLGQLSQWFSNIKRRQDKNLIAKPFGLDEVVLNSFLHHLTIVRNYCAHHSRLWNRKFTITLKLPKKNPEILINSFSNENMRKIYNTLVMFEYFMEEISPGTGWRQRLVDLFNKYPVVSSGQMGFPAGWQTLPIWK